MTSTDEGVLVAESPEEYYARTREMRAFSAGRDPREECQHWVRTMARHCKHGIRCYYIHPPRAELMERVAAGRRPPLVGAAPADDEDAGWTRVVRRVYRARPVK